ncbi:DUF397 domain-containing protein [Actinomadura logoneensis]|uniref:DUF397 domain-containing protein n=1 Tax=Actinomadura logoneensis TaxID=2293572 RepID=A0A372JJU4_9ACTN|nr:DUF397 domain-containing protein [Actinomadura logoneensis]RFU40292.1 DUF397 domain-containing protein [Actinomadura logoneensis]
MTSWRKSSHSDDAGGQCVEVAALSGWIGVRDSKAPDVGHVEFAPAAFADLLACVKTDRGAQSEA